MEKLPNRPSLMKRSWKGAAVAKSKNIQKKEMRLWMEANVTESITDGLTVVHKYDAAGLEKNTKTC